MRKYKFRKQSVKELFKKHGFKIISEVDVENGYFENIADNV